MELAGVGLAVGVQGQRAWDQDVAVNGWAAQLVRVPRRVRVRRAPDLRRDEITRQLSLILADAWAGVEIEGVYGVGEIERLIVLGCISLVIGREAIDASRNLARRKPEWQPRR